MKNFMNSIRVMRPGKNVFDLTHSVKLSCNMGELIPVMVLDCLPGDKFNCSQESLMRLAPLVAPMMDRVDVYFHTFFTPYRIVWPEIEGSGQGGWPTWITNGHTTGGMPAFPSCAVIFDGSNYTRLMDYMGIPDPNENAGVVSGAEDIGVLAFAAYQKIWNEYYRDQNLQVKVDDECIDGDNTAVTDLYTLRNRAWSKDYFTSALPTPQRGAVGVSIPIAGFNDVPVQITDTAAPLGSTVLTGAPYNANVPAGTPNDTITGDLYAETSALTATSASINNLRRAFRLQEWLELSMRAGARLVENIWAFFGVKPQDARLQRPEFVTGTKSPIVISEVLQTSETATSPQGNMAGHGIGVTSGKYGNYFVQEHGVLMTIMSVIPKIGYQQGIPKYFTKRSDPFEWYWPQFANIGEQEVLLRELYAYTPNSQAGDTFGYQARYAEYRFENNRVAGDFRTSLDFWTMSRKFLTEPALSGSFITADPTHRVFAVDDPSVHKLYVHVLNKVRAVRPIPKYGTPTF